MFLPFSEFKTPEEFFLHEKSVKFNWGPFSPEQYLKSAPKPDKSTYHTSSQEMIIMVGTPASGKSTFVKKHLLPHGYAHVNRDTLNTPAKCLKVMITINIHFEFNSICLIVIT